MRRPALVGVCLALAACGACPLDVGDQVRRGNAEGVVSVIDGLGAGTAECRVGVTWADGTTTGHVPAWTLARTSEK